MGLPKHPNDCKFKPFDIETTGFGESDVLTTLTLEDNGAYHVWLNTNGGIPDDEVERIEIEVTDESGEFIILHPVSDDRELLLDFEEYMDEHFDPHAVLVAYNGETWSGGFDIPFLRSACIRNDTGWILGGYDYIDLYPVYGKSGRFNTKVPSHASLNKGPMTDFAKWLGIQVDPEWNTDELSLAIDRTYYDFEQILEWAEDTNHEPAYNSYGDQVKVYQVLTGKVHDYDPWVDSVHAVTAWEQGDFAPLILHNVADVVKTKELTEIGMDYISPDDFSFKTL